MTVIDPDPAAPVVSVLLSPSGLPFSSASLYAIDKSSILDWKKNWCSSSSSATSSVILSVGVIDSFSRTISPE